VLFCVIALVLLGQGTTRFMLTRPAGLRAALRDPQASDGADLMLLLWHVQTPPQAGIVELSHQGRTVVVHTDALSGGRPDLDVGQVVTVQGTFRADDLSVQARELVVHRYRRVKQALGVVGMIVGLMALPLGFRVAPGGVVERG